MTEMRCARGKRRTGMDLIAACFVERQLASIRSERKHPLRTRILFLKFLSGALKIPVKLLPEPGIATQHRSHHIKPSQRLTTPSGPVFGTRSPSPKQSGPLRFAPDSRSLWCGSRLIELTLLGSKPVGHDIPQNLGQCPFCLPMGPPLSQVLCEPTAINQFATLRALAHQPSGSRDLLGLQRYDSGPAGGSRGNYAIPHERMG